MQTPLTALPLISDGARLSKWHSKMPTIVCQAADISSPESGNTATGAVPLYNVIWTVIVAAGSALSTVMFYNCICSPWGDCRQTALVPGWELLLIGTHSIVLPVPANSGKMTHLVAAVTDFVICWAVYVATLIMCITTCWTHMILLCCVPDCEL